MLDFNIPVKPELDHDFVPAFLWNREFRKRAANNRRDVSIAIERENDSVSRYDTFITADLNSELNLFYLERLIKFLIWSKGGWKILISGADDLVPKLQKIYSSSGEREFDCYVMGERIFRRRFEICAIQAEKMPLANEQEIRTGGHLDGCRIGFDLGGSDRKCAAIIDGECVFTEEVAWDPYFQADWKYHYEGIKDSIRRAAAKLPRVDAIGGSAAGTYINNQPRYASLFRGISDEDFSNHILVIFQDIAKEFDNAPIVVLNDGEVTALAGAVSFGKKSMLGLAMGTSEAIGYINAAGNLTDCANELAMAPIDYRKTGKIMDEWSKDFGVGANFLSQQAVGRLAAKAGFNFDSMPLPEQLKSVQEAMKLDHPGAAAIYRTIGAYLGYAVAHYCDFYDIENILLLGRASSGKGGEIIIDKAQELLSILLPDREITFLTPDEKFKRHGQAVVAASLPEIKRC